MMPACAWIVLTAPWAMLAASAFVDPETCEWRRPGRRRPQG